jgi:hypothetical protein
MNISDNILAYAKASVSACLICLSATVLAVTHDVIHLTQYSGNLPAIIIHFNVYSNLALIFQVSFVALDRAFNASIHF